MVFPINPIQIVIPIIVYQKMAITAFIVFVMICVPLQLRSFPTDVSMQNASKSDDERETE